MNKMYYMFYQNKYDFFLTSVNPLLEDTGKSQSMSIGSQKQKFYTFQKTHIIEPIHPPTKKLSQNMAIGVLTLQNI